MFLLTLIQLKGSLKRTSIIEIFYLPGNPFKYVTPFDPSQDHQNQKQKANLKIPQTVLDNNQKNITKKNDDTQI